MSENKEIFNKHHQRLFDVLLHNKQKYVDLVVNNKTNKYGGKNKEDVERAIDEIIDRGYLNKPVNYGENIQDDIVITASICYDIENQMIDKINIVKRVCKELGITQRELAERIGMSEGGLRSALSLGKITPQVEKACEMVLKIYELEKELENYKILQNALKSMIV